MNKNIKYSVITPVYNREDCIMRCVKSVEKSIQAISVGGIIEHVIVDDGSSDSTYSIVEKYAKTHPHVMPIRFENNKGTNAARNEAIRRASGEWCVLLDSDDYFCDTAFADIDNTISNSPSFKHYTFASDDMQGYYRRNMVINGAKQKILSYPDFLNGYVNCDFVHVVQREVLLRYPFDEQLRIYEGLFFLLFYRDVRYVLFSNLTVTIRERQRSDAVTRNLIRTNKKIIQKKARSGELMLDYFGKDMVQLGMWRRLRSVKLSLYENYVLLEEYSKAKSLQISNFIGWKERLLEVICVLKLGRYYRFALQSYLLLKYKMFRKKLKV